MLLMLVMYAPIRSGGPSGSITSTGAVPQSIRAGLWSTAGWAPHPNCAKDRVSAQAKASQTIRPFQRRDFTLTPASVHSLTTMTRLVKGDQDYSSLSQPLNTIKVGISEDLMPEEQDDDRYRPSRNPVFWD